MGQLFTDLQEEQKSQQTTLKSGKKSGKPEATSNPTQKSTHASDSARNTSRDNPRKLSRDLPTRDEIQMFSFQQRDELKLKVQAEVPHHWQKELEDIARDLNVKKLELYRFIFGEFLGKVRRKSGEE